jgi:hypothetical protein
MQVDLSLRGQSSPQKTSRCYFVAIHDYLFGRIVLCCGPMKTVHLFLLALGSLLFVTACAGEPPAAAKDDRIGVRTGVAISSRDMSRVAPTRPDVAPPN